jgi:hypothetical protein
VHTVHRFLAPRRQADEGTPDRCRGDCTSTGMVRGRPIPVKQSRDPPLPGGREGGRRRRWARCGRRAAKLPTPGLRETFAGAAGQRFLDARDCQTSSGNATKNFQESYTPVRHSATVPGRGRIAAPPAPRVRIRGRSTIIRFGSTNELADTVYQGAEIRRSAITQTRPGAACAVCKFHHIPRLPSW